MSDIIKELTENKNSGYQFKPLWVTDKNAVLNSGALKDFEELLKEEDFEIWLTSMDNLFNHLEQTLLESYSNAKIWDRGQEEIENIWVHWINGKGLNPPILFCSQMKRITLPDGKHRLAICKFFETPEIPVIILSKVFNNLPTTFTTNLRSV